MYLDVSHKSISKIQKFIWSLFFKNIQTVSAPSSTYGESTKPLEIDENEELERMALLKQRETLIRGMGKNKQTSIHKNLFFLYI